MIVAAKAVSRVVGGLLIMSCCCSVFYCCLDCPILRCGSCLVIIM